MILISCWIFLQYSLENNCVGDIQPCNFVKKRTQHRCFSVHIAKFLRTSILKKISYWLFLPLEVFCKDFVDISYENVSFRKVQDSIWLQVMYYLTRITYWFVKYLFWIDGDKLRVLPEDFSLRRSYRSNHPLWEIHGIAWTNFDCLTN